MYRLSFMRRIKILKINLDEVCGFCGGRIVDSVCASCGKLLVRIRECRNLSCKGYEYRSKPKLFDKIDWSSRSKNKPKLYYIECPSCGSCTKEYKTIPEVLKDWNSGPSREELIKELKARERTLFFHTCKFNIKNFFSKYEDEFKLVIVLGSFIGIGLLFGLLVGSQIVSENARKAGVLETSPTGQSYWVVPKDAGSDTVINKVEVGDE